MFTFTENLANKFQVSRAPFRFHIMAIRNGRIVAAGSYDIPGEREAVLAEAKEQGAEVQETNLLASGLLELEHAHSRMAWWNAYHGLDNSRADDDTAGHLLMAADALRSRDTLWRAVEAWHERAA